ncbi:hypothetical protein SAMN02799641_03024 [Rhodococcus erythropolis]|nr:hypothetical protein SAMN02799641_03024 [Rhodococcus erythropolis]
MHRNAKNPGTPAEVFALHISRGKMTETDSTRSERMDAAVLAMIGALRALRTAPPVEVPAYVWNVGTVDQWRNVTFDGDGKPVNPPVKLAAARTMSVAELDAGELYEALEQVEADNEALARVRHWWIEHRRKLGTSLGEAEATFTYLLGIARYVIDHYDAIAEATS